MDSYKYVDFINRILFIAFNIISELFFLLNGKLKKILKRNEILIQDNSECFILGNGPSLKEINWELLKNKDTFSVNWFYKHNNDFETKYYVAVDNVFYSGEGLKYLKDVMAKKKNVKYIFKYKSNLKQFDFLDKSRTFFIYPRLLQHDDFVKCNCKQNITACINVVLQCIQVAIFMNYKKIYLLGCEFDQYTKLKATYFYGEGRKYCNMGNDARWSALVHFHHYALYKYATRRGIEIINLTPNSLIDAYPRASLNDILSKGNKVDDSGKEVHC